MNRYSQLDQS
jgi:quinol monooxygenase YgiN